VKQKHVLLECGEVAVVNEEGCMGKVRPSATLVGLVSARKRMKAERGRMKRVRELACLQNGVTK
jgi:hypothetical protein